MGAGDVKLAIGTGALTGAFGMDVWTVSAVAAPLLTGVVALFRPANSTVPHGPSMCLSAAAATALAVW
jgi:leader peptidase (prepilin peptidase)/N-methyltransferase